MDEPIRWARWWLWLWGLVAIALLVLLIFLPFKWWAIVAAGGFGTMEAIGLLHDDDPYPPLTHVIHRYVPRWVAFSAIYGITGAAAGKWFHFHNAVGLGAVVGLIGWFNAHFDATFDDETKMVEHAKYQRIYRHTTGRVRNTS